MNENLFNVNCLKFHHIIHDMTASMHQQVLCSLYTRKNDILAWDRGLLRAVNLLQL